MEGPSSTTEFEQGVTEKQRWALIKAGLSVPPHLTFSDAQRLVKAIKVRKKKGLADFGMIRALSRHGIPAQQMYQATGAEILKLIQKHRGWTPPQEEIRAIINARQSGEDS